MRFALAAIALLLPGTALAGNAPVPIPEPGTLALLAVGVGGVALIRKLRGPRR